MLEAVPVHLRWQALALVAPGGEVGTGAREALALTWPAPPDGVPWTIAAINVRGAFVLGVLLEALGRRGPDEGRRRALRLFAGTGVLGSVVAGAAAAAAGIAVAARVLPGRSVAAGAGDRDGHGGGEPDGAAADGAAADGAAGDGRGGGER